MVDVILQLPDQLLQFLLLLVQFSIRLGRYLEFVLLLRLVRQQRAVHLSGNMLTTSGGDLASRIFLPLRRFAMLLLSGERGLVIRFWIGHPIYDSTLVAFHIVLWGLFNLERRSQIIRSSYIRVWLQIRLLRGSKSEGRRLYVILNMAPYESARRRVKPRVLFHWRKIETGDR